MADKKPTPEGLRKAAEEIENAAKVAAAAEAAKKTADTASKEAEKADAKAKAAVGAIGVGSGGNNNPPSPPMSVSNGRPLNPEKPGRNGWWRNLITFVLSVIALIVSIAAYYKASDSSMDDTKNDVVLLKKNVDQVVKGLALTDRKSDEALFASANKCDFSVCKEAEKPKCEEKKAEAPKRAQAKPRKPAIPDSAPMSAAPVAVPPPVLQNLQTQEKFFLWWPHDATPANPKPCIISGGNGTGLPAFCSSASVSPAKQGESKYVWGVRVGGGTRPTDTGQYTKGPEKGPALPAQGVYHPSFNN